MHIAHLSWNYTSLNPMPNPWDEELHFQRVATLPYLDECKDANSCDRKATFELARNHLFGGKGCNL